MHVEECCQAVLFHVLPHIDKKRKGVCIDIGVGTFAFYCELFACLGFESVAVEPLPVDRLRKVCRQYGIELIECCLSDTDGLQTLYIGTYHDAENLNLSSLSPDWWGASTETRQVRSMTLPTLLSTINARKVTCLKLDVEGMEATVVLQFQKIPESLLPKVVMFEYGGGDCRQSGKGGWSRKFLDATMECLSALKKCGYGSSVLIDRAPTTAERVFDLSLANLQPDQIFDPHSVYGNIISFRGVDTLESEIAEVCAPYRDNSTDPPALELPHNHLRRLWRRFRKVLIR